MAGLFDDVLAPASSSGIFDDVLRPTGPDETGIMGTLAGGARQTARSVGAALDVFQNDLPELQQAAAAQQSGIKDPRLIALQQDIAARKERLGSDYGWLDAIREVGGAAMDNPAGAGLMMLEQLPNSAAVMAAGGAGALAGSALGPAGTAAGAIAGGIGGMFLGNTALETGGKALEHVSQTGALAPEDRSRLMTEGAVKGGVITGIDAATLGLTSWITGTGRRAAERAALGVAEKAGVPAAEIAARRAADPAFDAAVLQAQKLAVDGANTLGQRVAQTGGALALETFGEGAGEYLGEFAATGEADKIEAVIEAFSSLGQSAGEIAGSYAWNKSKLSSIMGAQTADGAIAATETALTGATGAIDEFKTSDVGVAGLLSAPVSPTLQVTPDGTVGTAAQLDAASEARRLAGMGPLPAEPDGPGAIVDSSLPLVGQERPMVPDVRAEDLLGQPTGLMGASEPLVTPQARVPSDIEAYQGAQAKQSRGELLSSYERAILDAGPPSTPSKLVTEPARGMSAAEIVQRQGDRIPQQAPSVTQRQLAQEETPGAAITVSTNTNGVPVISTQGAEQTAALTAALKAAKVTPHTINDGTVRVPKATPADVLQQVVARLNTQYSAPRQPQGEAAATTQGERDGMRQGQETAEALRVAQVFGPGARLRTMSDVQPGERVTPTMRKVLTQLGRLTGTKVVFIASEGADGATRSADGNTVYVNTRASVNPLQVMGHEVTHVLKRKHRNAWAAIRTAVEASTDDAALQEFARNYWSQDKTKLDASQADGALDTKPDWLNTSEASMRDFLIDEMISDLGGERWSDPAFWSNVFADIEQKHGFENGKSIIQKLVAAIKDLINRFMILAKQDGFAEFQTEGQLAKRVTPEQLAAVRKAIESAYAEFIAAERTNEPEGYVRGAPVPVGAGAAGDDISDELAALEEGVQQSPIRVALTPDDVKKNPSPDRLMAMLKKSRDWSLRYVLDEDGNFYFWDAYLATHDQGARIAGISYDYTRRGHVYKDGDTHAGFEWDFGVTTSDLKRYMTEQFLFSAAGRGPITGVEYAALLAAEADNIANDLQQSTQREDRAPYEVEAVEQGTRPTNAPIVGEELVKLRRLAAAIERPRAGALLRITEDGRAIATGEPGKKIPQTFRDFARKYGLSFEARRTLPPLTPWKTLSVPDRTEPMPLGYRASGAQYAAEMGDRQIDRTGKTRFATKRTSDVGHTRTKSGDYVGAPPGMTPGKLGALRKTLMTLTKEGEPGRFWYEDSSRAILEAAEGDKALAEKIAGLLAIYSPQMTVSGNTTVGLKALYQWMNGKPIDAKTGSQDEKAQAWMDGTMGEDDALQIKTGNFFKNLMRKIDEEHYGFEKQGATIDMWMARVFGYGSKAIGSEARYYFAEREVKRIADALGWEPQQVQAALWVSIKSRVEEIADAAREYGKSQGWLNRKVVKTKGKENISWPPKPEFREQYESHILKMALGISGETAATGIAKSKYNFETALKERVGQISWEAKPGRTSGILPGIFDAPLEQQVEYLVAMDKALRDENGNDLIAAKLGLPVLYTNMGPSAWQMDVAAGAQTTVAVATDRDQGNKKITINDNARQLLNAYAAIRGYVLSQEAVVWHYPLFDEAKVRANGIQIDIGRDPSVEETRQLYQAVFDATGRDDWAPAFVPTVGWRILNFDGKVPNKEFAKRIIDVLKSLPDSFPASSVDTFKSEGDYISNDWKENPNGEGYRSWISGAGRSDLQGWVEGDLRDRTRRVEQEFAERYGWDQRPDATSSRTAGESPASQSLPRYGRAADRHAVSVTGVHYSREQRQTLSSAFFGTGMKGQERLRVSYAEDPRIKRRLYFYANTGRGVQPESDVGIHAHAVGLDNVYDMDVDPLKLYVQPAEGQPYRSVDQRMNDFESAVLDAGYDGYMTRDFGTGGAVVLLGDHSVPVQYEGAGARPTTDVTPEPRYNDLQQLRQKIAANRALPSGQMSGGDWKRLLMAVMPEVDPRWLDNTEMYYKGDLLKGAVQRSTPRFYSQLARSVTDAPAKMDGQPASQWVAWLAGNASKLGVKKEEIQWSGVLDWLGLRGKERTSREDVSGYLEQGGVQVETTVLGGPPAELSLPDEWYFQDATDDGYDGQIGLYDERNNLITTASTEQEALESARERVLDELGYDQRTGRAEGGVKFAEYVPPGSAGGYREVLLTLPAADPNKIYRPRVVETGPGSFDVLAENGNVIDNFRTWSQATDESYRIWQDAAIAMNRDTPRFASNHWEQPNVIAHLRYDTVAGANGDRLMRVIEIQSDWGQKGKKEGFNVPVTGYQVFVDGVAAGAPYESRNDAEDHATRALKHNPPDKVDIRQVQAPRNVQANLVPSAPFVTDTKSWTALAIKKAIMLAVEGDYDGIVFATGQQNADLYDLSKQISRISYANVAGDYFVQAVGNNGQVVFDSVKKENELEDIVGKEVAQKIINGEGAVSRAVLWPEWNGPHTNLSGLDLKVGGEGMRAYYDAIVPQVANDVLKKLGAGVKVGQVQLATYKPATGQPIGDAELDAEVDRMIEDAFGDEATPPQEARYIPTTTQPGFALTPELRATAQAGMPMFSTSRATANRWAYQNRQFVQINDQKFQDTTDREFARIIAEFDKTRDPEMLRAVIPAMAQPNVLQMLGLPNQWLGWLGDIVAKVRSKHKVMLPGDKLNELLRSPALVIQSGDDLEIISDHVVNGEPLMFAIIPDTTETFGLRPGEKLRITQVKSAYPLSWNDKVVDGKKQTGLSNRLAGAHGRKILYADQVKTASLFPQIRPDPGTGNSQRADYWVGEIEKRLREKKIRGYGDLVNWIDDRYKGAPENEPMFSTPRSQIRQSWSLPSLPIPGMDTFIRQMQDKLVDTKRVVAAIRAAGVTVKERFDPYLQETLFHGRAAKKANDFAQNELRPLYEDMNKLGVETAELQDYLWARHAPERNAQIAKVNTNMPDGGSGLTNQQAADILAGQPVTVAGRTIQINPRKMASYQLLANRVRTITNSTLDLLVASGLESQQTVDTWRNTYQNYVPLMRDMESDDNYLGAFGLGMGTGQGFSVRGAASKRAIGSERGVVDILANVAMQRERAITRAEKNRVAQAVYGLALTAPNPDFWLPVNPDDAKPQNRARVLQELIDMGVNPIDAQNIAMEPRQTYTDPRTGLVMQRINPALRGRDNVLSMRVDGKDRFIYFSSNERANEMVRNLKNLDAESLNGFLQIVAPATRYFASINTQFNPIFGITNGIRDVFTGMLNLSSTDIKDHRAEVLKNAYHALRGIYIDLRDHRAGVTPSSAWAQEFEEFAREGGQTGYRDMFPTSEARAKAIEREIRKAGKGEEKWKVFSEDHPVGGWLSDYNTSIENAVRLAAYKTYKDTHMRAGMTPAEQSAVRQRAAATAKNLTVNFNKKGLAATQMGAMYAFFNAAVQGTARIAETLTKRDPVTGKVSLTDAGKKIAYGGMMVGVMQAVMFALAGYDDEEPPQFIREKNFIIPIPGSDKYLSIPMPLGFHVLPNIGRIATEFVLSGGKNPAKRITQMAGTIADAFNPLGSSTPLQMLSPTIVDPLTALAENKDWSGKSIYKEDFNSLQPTAGWTRAKDTASPFGKFMAQATNYLTGGGKYQIGVVSPTPDQIDYLVGQITGGLGREVTKGWTTASSAAAGEELPLYKIPGIGRFAGETTGQAPEMGKFYDNIKRIGEHESALKEIKRQRDTKAYVEYMRENPDAAKVQQADKAYRDIALLKKQKRDAVEAGDRKRVQLIDAQLTGRVRRYNKLLSTS